MAHKLQQIPLKVYTNITVLGFSGITDHYFRYILWQTMAIDGYSLIIIINAHNDYNVLKTLQYHLADISKGLC